MKVDFYCKALWAVDRLEKWYINAVHLPLTINASRLSARRCPPYLLFRFFFFCPGPSDSPSLGKCFIFCWNNGFLMVTGALVTMINAGTYCAHVLKKHQHWFMVINEVTSSSAMLKSGASLTRSSTMMLFLNGPYDKKWHPSLVLVCFLLLVKGFVSRT